MKSSDYCMILCLLISPSWSFIQPIFQFWRVSINSNKHNAENGGSTKRIINSKIQSYCASGKKNAGNAVNDFSQSTKPGKYIHPEVFKMYHQAQDLIRNGDNAEARRLLYVCINKNEKDSHSWLALARLEAKTGNIQTARDLFARSLQLCPGNIHILHAWGLLEQKHGNIKLARECWAEAYAIDPLNAYVCHAFSNLERRLRNFEKAKEILQDVVAIKPTATICISLSELERQLGNADKAKEILTQGLLTVNKERSKMLLSLAWLEEDAFGKIDVAAELVEEAMQIDKYNVRVHIAKASLQLRQNKVHLARETLKQATTLSSDDAQHYTMWSTIEAESGNYDMARKILEKGAKQYPGDQFLLQRWGTIEAKHGSVAKARLLFAKSVQIQPHAPTYVAWAILEESEGQKALQREPARPKAGTGAIATVTPDMPLLEGNQQAEFDDHNCDPLCLCDGESGKVPAIGQPLTRDTAPALSSSTNKPCVADRDFAKQKIEEARQLFSTGMIVDPQHGPLYHAYGNMELRGGNITGARDIFKQGISVNCTDLTSLYHAWGLLEIKDSNRPQAEDIFRLGIKMGLKGNREVDHGVDFLLHSLGMLELYSRKFKEAKIVFRKGIELYPKHSHMMLGLALTSMKLGDYEGAREYFRASVDADALHLHAWQSWAIAEKQLGNIELARILFRQGLQHGPMHGALWQGYAVMEMQQGKFEVARTLFEESIRRSPAHAQSYQAWACLEARLGNLPIAKALAWRGIRRAPAHAALWTVAGVVEDRLGNIQRAQEIFEEGIQRFPDHGALYKVLGELHIRKGGPVGYDQARKLFAQALDQDPLYAPVYHAAAMLEAKLGNLERLSRLHQRAKAYFQSHNGRAALELSGLAGPQAEENMIKEQAQTKQAKSSSSSSSSSFLIDMKIDTDSETETRKRAREIEDIIERIKCLEISAKAGSEDSGAIPSRDSSTPMSKQPRPTNSKNNSNIVDNDTLEGPLDGIEGIEDIENMNSSFDPATFTDESDSFIFNFEQQIR